MKKILVFETIAAAEREAACDPDLRLAGPISLLSYFVIHSFNVENRRMMTALRDHFPAV